MWGQRGEVGAGGQHEGAVPRCVAARLVGRQAGAGMGSKDGRFAMVVAAGGGGGEGNGEGEEETIESR